MLQDVDAPTEPSDLSDPWPCRERDPAVVTTGGQGSARPILSGQKPGDRRVRVGREKPREYQVSPPRHVRRPPSPAFVLVRGFALLVAIGTLLLMLPFAATDGQATPLVDAFFTATSAVCVTGLVVVDTGTHWTAFGQVVILALIQLGGLGFMTASTLLLFVLVGRRTGLRDRMLVQASIGTPDLASATAVLARVAVFTAVVELGGFVVLSLAFLGGGQDLPTSLWWGLFTAISSFNNAGLDMGDFRSLTGFASDWLVLGTVAGLFILGGLGFAIVGDVAYKRRWTRLALETKVVVVSTVMLLLGGSVAIGLLEWSNPATLGHLPPLDRILNAFFTSATARTAGFNSIDTAGLVQSSLAILIALMFVGAASGSTAGGIKVNTFSLLVIAIWSAIRGDAMATAFGRRVPHEIVYRAVAVAMLSGLLVFGVSVGLSLATSFPILDLVVEATSAFGTVGLSTGITPELSDAAQVLVALTMFAGRLGPLTLVLALAARARPLPYQPATEALRIG
jgi:trk system potassium uptake protein TrkH